MKKVILLMVLAMMTIITVSAEGAIIPKFSTYGDNPVFLLSSKCAGT